MPTLEGLHILTMSSQCSISIAPENVKRTGGSPTFSGGIEMEQRLEMA